MRRRWQRLALGVGAAALVAIAAVHVPLVARHVAGGGCPFGYDRVARARPHAAPDASKPVARARPALGFALDATTREDVQAWAAAHGVACREEHGGTLIACTDIPASALPPGDDALPVSTAWLSFPYDDRLEMVQTVRRTPDASAAAAAFARQDASLAARTGAAGTRGGARAAEDLALGALREAHAGWELRDYRATLRATNLGERGYLVSERYAAVL